MGEGEEGQGDFRKLVSATDLLATAHGKAIALQEWMSTRLDILRSLNNSLMNETMRSVLGACHGDLDDIVEGHTQQVTEKTIEELKEVCKYQGTISQQWYAFFNDILEKMIQSGLAGNATLDPLPPKQAVERIARWIASESAIYEQMHYVPFRDGGKGMDYNTAPRNIQLFKEALYEFYKGADQIQEGGKTDIFPRALTYLRSAAAYARQLPILKTMANDIIRKITLYNLAQGIENNRHL